MRTKFLCGLSASLLCLVSPFQMQAPHPTTNQGPTPLILERNQGERRLLRPRPDRPLSHRTSYTPLTLKVDPKNGGSEHFVLFTEVMPPGDVIPKHCHPGADEILIFQTGTAKVTLGDKVQEVQAGAIVFIPSNTWIGAENIGKEPVSLIAEFSAPGFEEWMRAVSVKEGEKVVPLTRTEVEQLQKQHSHAVIFNQ